MPYLILPDRFKRQPQRPVEIDRNNPLTEGLIYAVNPAAPKGSVVLAGNGKKITNRFGHAFDGNAVNQANAAVVSTPILEGGEALTSNSPRSGLIVGTLRSVPGATGQYMAGVRDSTDADTAYAALLWINSTSGMGFSWSSGYSNIAAPSVGDIIFSGGVAAPSNNAVAAVCFYNGLKRSAIQYQDGAAPAQGSVSKVQLIGRASSANRSLDGNINLALFWSRFLSDGEHKALHENPWQVFKPALANRLYFFPTAGGSSFHPAWAANSNILIQPGLAA